ncbi:MAG: SRPBCC family protein, partial [Pseudonocardiaceae bacterium]
MAETKVTTQVYRVYIKATPQAIWDAITKPEWTQKYGYQAPVEYDLRPGGGYRGLASDAMLARGAPEVVIGGEVIEVDPPRKLVQTWRALFDPETAAEAFTRVTWEIDETDGVSMLTVTHELDGAPKTAALVSGQFADAGGGWSYILSDLKT